MQNKYKLASINDGSYIFFDDNGCVIISAGGAILFIIRDNQRTRNEQICIPPFFL